MGEGGGGLEGENHKRETDCCFRPFSSLPSFHHNSLAANGGEDGDERRKEERRKGPLLSLLSLLSSSFHQWGNACHPIFRQVKKQSTFFAKLSNPQKSRNRKFQTPQNWSPSIRARHLKSEVLLVARSVSVWDGKAIFNQGHPTSIFGKYLFRKRFEI